MTIVKLFETKFKENLCFLELEPTWQIGETQKKAAWDMYVELATRINSAELKENEGLLCEAIVTLHSLFEIPKAILKELALVLTPSSPDDTALGH